MVPHHVLCAVVLGVSLVRGNHNRRLRAFWRTIADTSPQVGPSAVVHANESVHPCGPLPEQAPPFATSSNW